MPRLAPLCVFMIALAAATMVAGKPQARKPAGDLAPPPPPKAAKASGLRGPLSLSERAIVVSTPLATPRSGASWLSAAPASGAALCRQACAQSRYVCLSDPDAPDCDAAWGQCVAHCVRP